MPPRTLTSRLTEWTATIVSLLIVALVSWGCSNVMDVQARIVRLETKVDGIEKTLDRIENNTAPHDGRMAAKP